MWMSKWIKAKATELPNKVSGLSNDKYMNSLDDKTRAKVIEYADVFKGTALEGFGAQGNHAHMVSDKAAWSNVNDVAAIDKRFGRDREGVSQAKDDSARIESMFTASANSLKQARGRSGGDRASGHEWDAASGSFAHNNKTSNVIELKVKAAEKELVIDHGHEIEI